MSQFATITSEGGLLPPDLLARIVDLDKSVPGLTPADYRLDEGQKHGEAISRSWSRLLPAWRAFRAELEKLPETDAATSITRDRFLQPLLQELGYGRVPTAKALAVDGKNFAITHAWGDTPIHLLGARVSLEARTVGQAGAAKSSPHGLVQELLNRSEPHLWGILSNGLVLRLLRDHHSLTSQAYVEVDLEALFEGERYADFALVWLVFHQSRVEPRDGSVEHCWLEKWFALSREEGLAALDDLRDGVVAAIEALGKGFLRHPKNQSLQNDLVDNVLDKQDYYRELLRLAYRLIFLFSAEDRGVLSDPAAHGAARDRYRRFYATRRLRELAGVSRGGPHGDLWQALRAVMNALDDGCAPLALPALGSFLWSADALPHLNGCELANADLLAAIRALSYLERHRQRFPVSWRTVAADELGSIYESLLELHPRLETDGTFELTTAAGSERKKTGSYYTPTSLVDCLLDSALDPVIDAARKGKSRADAETALLALRIVDPACGSGHFLVAAARRLARQLARVRTGDDEPSPRELQHALRDVVGHCIYGVDLNEMAVELCKVALWMEAVDPGKPLSFLDANIQHGNALIGATPALLAQGIPDDAWNPIEGDHKEAARALKKRNRDARKTLEKSGQADMFAIIASPGGNNELATAAGHALAGGDDEVAEVRARKRRWEALQSSPAFKDAMFVADTWCAAFTWPKHEGLLAAEAPTQDAFARIRTAPESASKTLRREVATLASQYTFFHWHLAFPQVFANGGFDAVVGNPPWEKVKLQEREYFASVRPEIATAQTAAIRSRLIEELRTEAPEVMRAFELSVRQAEGETAFIVRSGRFPYGAVGDTNTYPLFVELGMTIGSPIGRVGLVVKTGLLADYSLRGLFAHLVENRRLVSGFDFSNRRLIFPAVVANERFTLLTLVGPRKPTETLSIAVLCEDVADLDEPGRVWLLSADDIALINPNTHTCPLFQRLRDATIVADIYRRVPILIRDGDSAEANPWGVQYYTMFHMTNDSGGFRDLESLQTNADSKAAPQWKTREGKFSSILEGKLFDQFTHRHGTFDGIPRSSRFGVKAEPNHPSVVELTDPSYVCLPRYWIDDALVKDAYAERLGVRPGGVLAFRDVCRTHTDLRTVRATIAPPYGAGNKAPLLIFPGIPPDEHARRSLLLCGLLNSFVLDYIARQKFAGGSLNRYILVQFPVPPPSTFTGACAWKLETSAGEFIRERVLELVYTAWELELFAHDAGFDGPPFPWDSERRAHLRAEIDAAVFHVYGLARSETEYVLDTFPVLRNKELREFGEYRTRRLILERYDAMSVAAATRRAYVSASVSSNDGTTQQRRQLLADASWTTPAGVAERDLTLFALLDVIRHAQGPIEAERVRLASIFVRKPAMALPFMDEATRQEWNRLVGKDAEPLPANVLDLSQFKKNAIDHLWRDVVTQLTGSGVLLRNSETNEWSAGPGLPESKQPWIEGRAEMAIRLVRGIELAKVEKKIASFLKDVKRGATA